MKQKSSIVVKMFRWNVFIFTILLLLQLFFQSALFEPFLARAQQRRLSACMDSMMMSLQNGDTNHVRQLVQDADDQGIVLAAVDKDMNLLAGQNFDQYQRCFILSNGAQKRYTIVEDYLESAPLQSIEVGDEVSIEGFLIDEVNALVIPSKVYRTRDGAVLGTDTFLLVNNQGNSSSNKSDAETASENGVCFSDDASTPQDDKSNAGNSTLQVDGETIVTAGANPTDSADKNMTGITKEKSAPATGFVLSSPFEMNGTSGARPSDGAIAGFSELGSTIYSIRILIVNNDGRSSGSYPITLAGTVEEKDDFSNSDLLIPRGLVTAEIKHLANANASAQFSKEDSSYSVTKQLTTGKYLLDISFVADRQFTLMGAISLYSVQDINGMMNRFHILLYSLELILFAGSIYAFSRKIAKPLIEMNGVALKIAQQDFSSKVQISTDDEFATLGNSINEISMKLEQKIQQINEINERLQHDYERQLELYQRHKQLSATYSHEIKTPLTILRGHIDGIRGGVYPCDQEESYRIVLRELDSASGMIAQMLEIAKMESPYFILNKSIVDLWMIFYKEYDALKQTIDHKGMRIVFHATQEAYTRADAQMMGTVVSNALTNAMKYSPHGSRISVRVQTELGQHIFSVENENALIPKEELEKIWEPFYRSKEARASLESGSGLGLVIVGEILQAHGFEHGIRNTDRGVEFFFVCPIASMIE